MQSVGRNLQSSTSQAPLTQVYGEQISGKLATQLPCPSQTDAGRNVALSRQVGDAHTVPAA